MIHFAGALYLGLLSGLAIVNVLVMLWSTVTLKMKERAALKDLDDTHPAVKLMFNATMRNVYGQIAKKLGKLILTTVLFVGAVVAVLFTQ